MKFENYTPHAVVLNNGTVFEPVGLARVSVTFGDIDENGISHQTFGEVTGLPAPQEGVCYIVSALVLSAAQAQGRSDVVAPATGHPECVRENGFIKSVPCFVQ